MIGTNRGWKKLSFAAAVLMALVLTLAPWPAGAINLKAGMDAPDFTVPALQGGDKIALHDFQGRVVMVMFWSSWCARCKEEMEFLKGMKAKFPALNFLALNSETDKPLPEDITKMKQAVMEWNIPFVIGIDEGLKVWDLYKVNALPTSMIIGADGKLLFIEANFYWASPETIENTLQAAFAPKAP